MKKDCKFCEYYHYVHANISTPYDECYCFKHWIDFTVPPEPDDERKMWCDDFSLSRYGKEKIKEKRKQKLKRILNDE